MKFIQTLLFINFRDNMIFDLVRYNVTLVVVKIFEKAINYFKNLSATDSLNKLK